MEVLVTMSVKFSSKILPRSLQILEWQELVRTCIKSWQYFLSVSFEMIRTDGRNSEVIKIFLDLRMLQTCKILFTRPFFYLKKSLLSVKLLTRQKKWQNLNWFLLHSVYFKIFLNTYYFIFFAGKMKKDLILWYTSLAIFYQKLKEFAWISRFWNQLANCLLPV